MAQNHQGMTFLNGSTMTLSYGYDKIRGKIDNPFGLDTIEKYDAQGLPISFDCCYRPSSYLQWLGVFVVTNNKK